jgi:hypothetical protein
LASQCFVEQIEHLNPKASSRAMVYGPKPSVAATQGREARLE